ncbi:ferredoxin reductase family protein [Halomonas sp. 328]|uniref:ferredoxin reductase family protein n=1 Tax=Halomonas sp. 328 TaxID=2776704 RepID=UPI001E4381BA|nr:ferredoxin reductase family protein [Halomonas sp. 328]
MTIWRRPYAGDLLVVLLVLLPLVVALPRLGWPGPGAMGWLSWLGRVSGILGLAMMLVTAALCVRLPRWDRYFGGLPRLWRLHRGLGFWAFILVMVHVLSLALAAVPLSLEAAALTLFPPWHQVAIWLGWLAWGLMVIFLAPTFDFFGKLHYQGWKRLHLLSAVALIAALVHTLWLAGESALWWLLGLLALGAIFWRKAIAPRVARLPYRIENVEPLARGVVELALRPEHHRLRHRAGQFLYLTPLDEALSAGRGEEHPYTISSAPDDSHLRIGIKDLGDASRALQAVTPGSRVLLEGPYGDFFARHFPQRRPLWLGGGIGITPFVGMAREIAATGVGEAQLVYLANGPERAYYLDELRRIAEAHPGFGVTAHFYRKEGPLTETFLRHHCPDYMDREIYLCGPPAMVDHLRRLLADQGVPTQRIHSEVFDFL